MWFLGQNGRIKSFLNAELYKKTSKTGLYKVPKRRYAFRFPSHLWSYAAVCCGGSCLLRWSPCCATALYYDYILEITLTNRQTVYERFYSSVTILCCLIKIDVGETKCKGLSSMIPHISKNDRLFCCCSQRLKSIANNRIDANLMIKQYTIFRYLQQLSQNIGSDTFIRIYSSYFAQENLQGKAQRTHTPYADSDVLQNFNTFFCFVSRWIFAFDEFSLCPAIPTLRRDTYLIYFQHISLAQF